MRSNKIEVVLLAAGQSKRTGQENKLLLPFSEKTILETTVNHILQSNIGGLIVVIGHEHIKLRRILEKYDIRLVINKDYKNGQVSSIKKGLTEMREKSSFMIALADMPLINKDHYNLLISSFAEMNLNRKTILRPGSPEGRPGNPVLFDKIYRRELLDNKNRDSSKAILAQNGDCLSYFETNIESFFLDIDTLEDYGKFSTSG